MQREMRKRIFEIIEAAGESDISSKIYDVTMIVVIILSLIPCAVRNISLAILLIDIITTTIFISDYILRLMTADFKLKKGRKSFVIYPFTPMAVIDLVSILPSLLTINNAFRVLKILRLLRTFRVFRMFKIMRYSKSITIIGNVFKKQKESLLVVGGLAVGYILASALIVVNIEPDTFPSFFDAMYWATVSLTTVGYGDIYAVSTAGKIITMLSAIFGTAIVALPAGIVTAGYLDELNQSRRNKDSKEDSEGETHEKGY